MAKYSLYKAADPDTWASGTPYVGGTSAEAGDGHWVAYGGNVWRAIADSTGQTPSEGAYWTQGARYTNHSDWETNEDRTSTDMILEYWDEASEEATLAEAASSTRREIITPAYGRAHSGYDDGTSAGIANAGKCVDVATTYVSVLRMRLHSTGGGETIDFNVSANAGGVANNNVIITSAVYGISAYNTEVHGNVIVGTLGTTTKGVAAYNGTNYITHNSVTKTAMGYDEGNGTTYVFANIGLGNTTDFDSGFDASSDYNWSSDSTAPGTNAQTSIDPYAVWQSPDEGDLRLCYSRPWQDDTVFGARFDGGAAPGWTIDGTASIGSAGALSGDNGLSHPITTGGSTSTSGSFGPITDGYIQILFRLRGTIADGETAGLIMRIYQEDGGALEGYLRCARSGAAYTVHFRYQTTGGVKYGSSIPVSPDTTYKFRCRLVAHATTGIVEWWLDEVGSSYGSARNSWTSQDTSGNGMGQFYLSLSGYDATPTGYMDYDECQAGTTALEASQDGASPYGDEFTAALTGGASYSHPSAAPSGASYFPSTDITGTAWADYHVGPDDYSLDEGAPPAATGNPWYAYAQQ